MQTIRLFLLGIGLLLTTIEGHTQKLVSFKENGKFGFKDAKGNVVIQLKYDNALDFFEDNIGAVSLNNKLGFINSKGVELKEIKYDAFKPENHLKVIWVFKNDKIGLINFQGKELTQPIFSDTKGFLSRNIAPVKIDSLWGYINSGGKLVTSSSYQEAHNLINNRSKVVVQKNGNRRVGFIDQTGKVVVPFEYPDCSYFDSNGIAITNEYAFNNQAIDTMGRVVIPFCKHIVKFNDKLYAVKKTDGTFVFVDSKNKTIRETKFTSLSRSIDNLSVWRLEEGYNIGYIDENFNVVIECIYDDGAIYYTDLIPVKLNRKWGVVNLKGKAVIPFEYDELTNYNLKVRGTFDAEKEGVMYKIDSRDNVVK